MSVATPLAIERLDVRYVDGAARARVRLDGLLRHVVDETLEPAVERATGLAADELVCVRRVDAPVRLALGRRDDDALANDWADVIAAAVAQRLEAGGEDVVRYGSRPHALLDMALGLAAGDGRREWAWRAAGLWPATEPTAGRALVLALAREGATGVVPALAHVARAGLLGGLVAILTPAAWLTLAGAALRGAGASHATIAGALGADPAPGPGDGAVSRALRRSEIAAALRFTGAPAVAVAALALVEVQPAAVAALGDGLGAALAAAARPARAGVESPLVPPADPRDDVCDDPAIGEPGTTLDATAPDPEHAADGGPPRDGPGALDDAPDGDGLDERAIPERARGASAYGGLVFALHAVVALDLPPRFASLPGEVDLRTDLHALALALSGAEPGDPAALAFAGLAPDAEPPRPPDGKRQDAIEVAASDVRIWLAARLDVEPGAFDSAALLYREALVVADAGWIEAHLRLDEVDTATRRAGLDLDPGHLPFLGCVVRIVYA